MATDLNINDHLRVSFWSVLGGQAAVTDLYFVVTSVGVPPATDQDAATQFNTSYATLYKDLLSANATYRGVQAQIVNRTPMPAAVDDVSLAGVGLDGTPVAPGQVRGLISWRTPFAGRKYRGRSYMPWVATPRIAAGGAPDAVYIAALVSLATPLTGTQFIVAGARTASLNLVILHRADNSVTPIATFIPEPRFATQRRSGLYGRGNVSPI